MALEIPDLQDAFIETVGCCWRVAVDELPDLKGRQSIIAKIDENRFCRYIVEKDRSSSRYGKTAHVHIEIATLKYFENTPPEISGTIAEIAEKIAADIGQREKLKFPSITIEFKIPMGAVAVGSALGATIGLQSALVEHDAVLTRGRLELKRNNDSPPDYFSFCLEPAGDKMLFDITVQGVGESSYSVDCLKKAAARGTEVFNKLALAKPENNQ